jgi:hypothetical protein
VIIPLLMTTVGSRSPGSMVSVEADFTTSRTNDPLVMTSAVLPSGSYSMNWPSARARAARPMMSELADEVQAEVDAPPSPSVGNPDLEARVAELEKQVASMRRDQVRACGGDATYWETVGLMTGGFVPPETR